jgi:hypothetical protein
MEIVRNVRMRVLKDFTRRVDGQLVVGDPEHPDEEGRILMLSEAGAVDLENAKLAERYSHEDEALEQLAADSTEGADGGPGQGEDGATANTNLQTRDGLSPQNRETSTQARTRRADNTRKAGGNPRRKPRGNKTPAAGEAGGAPTGGNETTATTNHPTSSLGGDAATSTTNKGADGVPDPDAAPTE